MKSKDKGMAMGGNVTVKPAMPKPMPKGPMVMVGGKPKGMAKGGMSGAPAGAANKGAYAMGGMTKKGKK
jgi:hypothetical protein